MSDKLDLQTPDLVNQNIQKIATLFPNCITETAEGKAIDFDLLRQELNHEIVEGSKERYRLEWPGKREAIVTANLPTTKTLRPVPEESVNFDTTENLYIEGDNLEVLKLLQESYLGKIKMIYIDPPYNTGNDFVYKDNFAQDTETFKAESGQTDELGNRLVANPETSGRYHSDWLTMMYPRLKLARNLLTDDGVIFISIDDNEVHNLRKICDEIFGEGNFVAHVIWQKKYSPQNDAKYFSASHEHILLFSKSILDYNVGLLPRTDEANARYKNPDNDPKGPWKSSDLTRQEYRPNDDYKIVNPINGKEFSPPPGNSWGRPKKNVEEMISENRIWFGSDGNSVPSIKRYLSEVKQGITPQTIWMRTEVGDTQEGKKTIIDIFKNASIFETPKPSRLIIRQMLTANFGNSDIVLDFFSGSATTAHAVMQLNAEDGGNRKFIMVQLPEKTDEKSEAWKAGYKNICEIGKERIRRAAKKIQDELAAKAKPASEKTLFDDPAQPETHNSQPDFGFRVYRLDTSNMQDVYYRPQDYKPETIDMFADNIKPDRTPHDLLAQVMLDWGLPLSYRIEEMQIAGKQVFRVAQNSLIACFDNGINEAFAKELAIHTPLRVVFRDRSFATDTAKENVKQLLKQLSPETEMRVI
jgi:adenine-specific DNA-methyltransferase